MSSRSFVCSVLQKTIIIVEQTLEEKVKVYFLRMRSGVMANLVEVENRCGRNLRSPNRGQIIMIAHSISRTIYVAIDNRRERGWRFEVGGGGGG